MMTNRSKSPQRASKMGTQYPSTSKISVHRQNIKDFDELSEVSEIIFNGIDWAAVWRVSLVVFILGCLIFFTVDMFTTHYTIHFLEWFVRQVKNMNPFLLIVIITLFTAGAAMIAFPFLLLAMSGAYLLCYNTGLYLGITLAVLTNDVGTCLGAALTYKVSQSTFRPYILEISSAHKSIRGIEGALKKKGFWINFLLRLSPIIPTVLVNYTIPAMGTSFEPYILGCFFGTLPYSIVLSVLGGLLSNINSIVDFVTDTPLYIILLSGICGVVLVIVGTWILFKYSHEALEEACEAEAETASITSNNSSGNRPSESTESDPLLNRDDKHII